MNGFITKSFRIADEGLRKVLGPLEKDVMDVLWSKGEASGKDVFEELRKGREIAVTTVFTVLERLAKKGLLRKLKGESVYIFKPVHSREELARKVSEEVLKGVYDLFKGSAVASFVDIIAEEDPAELDRLAKIVSEKKSSMVRRGRK